MDFTVYPKIFEGAQAIRRGNYCVDVLAGAISALGINPSGSGDEGESKALLVIERRVTLDIRKSGDGGVMSPRNSDGSLPDGIYYLFVGATTEPNDEGIIVGDNNKVVSYLSNVFGSFGSRNFFRNIAYDFPRLTYTRPHPAAFYVQDNKLYPIMPLGEGTAGWTRFTYEDYQPFKAAHVGGMYYDGRNMRYDDDNAEPMGVLTNSTPARHRQADGSFVDGTAHWVTFFRSLPESHKWLEVQIEYTGQGSIHASNNAFAGRALAVANGDGVTTAVIMPRSEVTGRAMKFTVTGSAQIKRIYTLATQAQQPM